MSSEHNRPKIHYAWVIFAVSILMVFTVLGFCSSTRPLYLTAVTEGLQISRSLYSLGNSMRCITTALINLLFGALITRFGARKMIAMGFGCLIGSCVVYSFTPNIVGVYLGDILLGLGLAWTTTTMVGFVVEKWFTSKKGTIMGFVLAANGVGGACATQILSPVINSGLDGWRNSYRITMVVLLCVGAIVLVLLRNSPAQKGLAPLGDGTAPEKKRGRQWMGLEYRVLRKRKYYYLVLFSVFLTGMLLQSLQSITSAHMKDRGIGPELIAAALSIHSLVLTLAKTMTGISYDKFGLRITMIICNICAVTAILLLAFVSSGPMAIAAETISSFALPLQTIMLPLITSELFGSRAFGQTLGQVVAMTNLGYAVGSPLMNVCYDIFGTYTGVMASMAGVMFIVAVMMQYAITAAHKERMALERKMPE